jgi:hypothetical protein
MNKKQKKWAKKMPRKNPKIYWDLPFVIDPAPSARIFDPIQALLVFFVSFIILAFAISPLVWFSISNLSIFFGMDVAVVNDVSAMYRHYLFDPRWWHIPSNVFFLGTGGIFYWNYSGFFLGYLPIYLSFLLTLASASSVTYWIAKPEITRQRPMDDDMHTLDGKEAFDALIKNIAAERKGSPAALRVHSYLPLLSNRRATRGMLAVGGIGTGKTTVLLPIMSPIVKAKRRVLIYDYKGDFTQKFNIPIMAPWDCRSMVWDIAKDITNKSEVEMFVGSVVIDSADPMWATASRQFLQGGTLYCIHEFGDKWTLHHLCSILSDSDKLKAAVLAFVPEGTAAANAMETVTGAGILINLGASLSAIFAMADLFHNLPKNREKWSVAGWLSCESEQQIILQGHPTREHLARSLAGTIFQILLEKMANAEDVSEDESDKRRTYLFVDELPTLGLITALPKMVSVLRSKGLVSVFAFQDPAQIVKIYGPEDLDLIWSSLGTKIILGMAKGKSADAIVGHLGERNIERLIENVSAAGAQVSRSWTAATEAVMTSSELNALAVGTYNGVPGYITAQGWPDLYYLSWPMLIFPNKRQSRIPNNEKIKPFAFKLKKLANDENEVNRSTDAEKEKNDTKKHDDIEDEKKQIITNSQPSEKNQAADNPLLPAFNEEAIEMVSEDIIGEAITGGITTILEASEAIKLGTEVNTPLTITTTKKKKLRRKKSKNNSGELNR